MNTLRMLSLFILIATVASCSILGSEEEPTPFSLRVVPAEITDAAAGQPVVLLVAIEDSGEGSSSGEPVKISATAIGAEIAIEPADGLTPGVVGEITVVPDEDLSGNDQPASIRAAYQPEPVATIHIEIKAERQNLSQTQTVAVGIVPADAFPLEAAEEARDAFVPWLAENHPELGITPETEWTAIPAKPHWLVVSHYLFFSDRWEMGVRWHIMIPPFNWAEIYLRERFVEVEPSLGFKVDSLTEDPVTIYPVEVVEPVWR